MNVSTSTEFKHGSNLVPRVSHLTAPGSKMRDPGNEVDTVARSLCLLPNNWSFKWQRVSQKKSNWNYQAQPPDQKLGQGQENNRVYWLLTDFQIWCLVQGFTTKASFARLLCKLILIYNLYPKILKCKPIKETNLSVAQVLSNPSQKNKCCRFFEDDISNINQRLSILPP